ncbi:helix-loop-helix DNA-binding domain-containing protein 6 [Elsinoe australis]|uniref:Helix-loop-helix DNA-binding domain-containing protein 6 n=1 Tax=Elsinoe australis TaxID=40998 RepID=A0A4U7ATZ7_9PEZI|nr:helix-loop-helix DNA-binding domain-containing protein 6 [Elsinoe australis]
MPNTNGISFTEFPPFDSQTETAGEKHDSPFEFTFEDHFEEHYNNVKSEMAGAGSPYIKSEGNDFFNFNQFSPSQPNNGFDMNNNFNNVHPTQLGQNNGQQFGQNSFNMGNAGIADDELADLAGSLDTNQMRNQQGFFNDNNGGSVPMPMGQQNMNSIYSSTPEGAPIQSPFVNHDGFNYNQFRPVQQQRNMNLSQSTGFASNVMRAQHINNMERKISESRSPASPHTPGLNNLHIGEPEFPTSMRQQMMSTSVPANWDGTPNAQSWNDNSPYPSPASVGHHMHHAQISEVLRSEDHRPQIKTESGSSGMGYSSVEAKRRRRRESHNLVERRRRDNINERIQDLANLVPQHRLEDEKVRKHLQTNSPLSPSITATSMSPPQSSSVLSTSGGRRGGAITQGLPMDDKDKGPNKGDILNSSVSWTRDVVWYLKMKMEQEAQLEEILKSNGIEWPFSRSNEEKRMRSEIQEVIERNVRANNITPYTRAEGTGLRVPGFTNIAGDTLPGPDGGESNPNQHPGPSHWQPVFKEEDEFDEDML